MATNEIMKGLEMKNWATITRRLRRLEEAHLLIVEERAVGRYKSKAKFWSLEPRFGVKVAAMLEEANRWGVEASISSEESPKTSERAAIVDIESAGQKLVMVIQRAVEMAAGKID